MKATIYTRDGKVCREVECDGAEPYINDIVRIVGAEIYTNQPIVVHGTHEDWDHMLEGSQKFDLTLTIGKIVRKWDGARALVVLEGVVSFWHKGEWHSVTGDVLIENMRSGGPVELE